MIIVSKRLSIQNPLKIVCPFEMIKFRELFGGVPVVLKVFSLPKMYGLFLMIYSFKWCHWPCTPSVLNDRENDCLLETQQRVRNPMSFHTRKSSSSHRESHHNLEGESSKSSQRGSHHHIEGKSLSSFQNERSHHFETKFRQSLTKEESVINLCGIIS